MYIVLELERTMKRVNAGSKIEHRFHEEIKSNLNQNTPEVFVLEVLRAILNNKEIGDAIHANTINDRNVSVHLINSFIKNNGDWRLFLNEVCCFHGILTLYVDEEKDSLTHLTYNRASGELKGISRLTVWG